MTHPPRGPATLRRQTPWLLTGAALLLTAAATAQTKERPTAAATAQPKDRPAPAAGSVALPSDIPAQFTPARDSFDYVKREVMIPMRDGVRLHTVVMLPRGITRAPILLTRTPYGADRATAKANSSHLTAVLARGDDIVAVSGYIRVFQDVRGKYGSEGDYVMSRPVRGPLNPTAIDHCTDTYDTIDWLVKNTPEASGKVGMIGTSYPGFLVLLALLQPHPALKVAVSIAPMVDTWVGDDWFHHGAFRQSYALDYTYEQTAARGEANLWRPGADDYATFLKAGSADALGRYFGLDKLPFWQRLEAHPSYDSYWQSQAVDKLLTAQPLKVPTLHVHGLWDQEDIYGAIAAYKALEPKDRRNDLNYLVLGPWGHGGSNIDGSSLGAIRFDSDTGLWFRRTVLQPFLDQYLKDGAPRASLPPVLAFETGSNTWKRPPAWPPQKATRALYLQPEQGLAFQTPPASGPGFDEYIADPAKPVPYRHGPIAPVYGKTSTWGRWLVDDQREFSTRPDVLTYTGPVLTAPLTVSGEPVAHLLAATSGTDVDFVVKLIDCYPDEVPAQPELGGYQLAVSMDILRGRYRHDPAHPTPVTAGKVEAYTLPLPAVSHVFLPGHRIMVQVQSSWFPLYDRNPQTYVDNIFFARPADYKKATIRVLHTPGQASFLELPVAAAK
ncbi:MAG TPA: CocE/NonD family hydrolase [Pseudomonadota bacterium]|nr:CocE/NonD family hydrolase [Pseudomonadota bacterium]